MSQSFSFTDQAAGTETTATAQQIVEVVAVATIYGGVRIPLVPQGTPLTIALPVCTNNFYVLSNLSCNQILRTHCPNEVIPPSLFNNRKTTALCQINSWNTLLQQLGNKTLLQQLNQVYTVLNSIPDVSQGDYVSHEHFNALYNYVSTVWNILNWIGNNVFGGFTNMATLIGVNYFNILGSFMSTETPKRAMDILYSKDWNLLTQALYAIDQILQYLLKYISLIQLSDSANGSELLVMSYINYCPLIGQLTLSTPSVVLNNQPTSSVTTSAGASTT